LILEAGDARSTKKMGSPKAPQDWQMKLEEADRLPRFTAVKQTNRRHVDSQTGQT